MTVNRRPAPGEPLTLRELEVLRGMALGMTNPQIGELLFLTEDTIKTHARRMFDKLGTANRTLAVLAGIAQGLLACPCVSRRPQSVHPMECYTPAGCQCAAVAS